MLFMFIVFFSILFAYRVYEKLLVIHIVLIKKNHFKVINYRFIENKII